MIRLQPVRIQPHRALIAEWLATDHVARWWGDPASCLELFDNTPATNHVMISSDDEAIGYIRWETVDLAELDAIGLADIPEGSVDMDIFIGDPGNSGRGAGAEALRLVFDHLFETTNVPLIGLCTSVENTIAHKAFEKAGCERTARFDDDLFGACWVYSVQRDTRGLGP